MSEDNVTPTPEEPQGATAKEVIVKTVKVASTAAVTPWKMYLILLLTAVSLVQTIRLGNRDTEIATFEGKQKITKLQIDMLEIENKKCKAAFDDQNKKISDAADDAQELKTDFDAFKKTMDKKVKDAYKRADDIAKKNTPKNCAEAHQFLIDNLGKR